jgi:DNA-binding GntR family transcriptional regulator
MLPLAETKASAAYKEIRSQILNGSLEPGSTVNQEVLAASLGLSTTPIREALRMLDAEGLVALKPHKDAVVASLTLRELTEVLALRLELDPFAASLAAEVASAAERDIVVRLAEAGSPSSPQEQLAANRLFHRTIYAASGNQLLTQILDSLWDRTDRYRLAVLRDRRPRELLEHEHHDIAYAFRNGQTETLVELVRQHVLSSRHLLLHFSS